MEKLVESKTSSATILVAILAIVFTPWGIYHAYNRHGYFQGIISTFFPPYAWYMAAESFDVHDDFAGVDWDERIASDTRTGILLLNASLNAEPLNTADIDRAVVRFRVSINSYPAERTEQIRQGVRLYIDYMESLNADIVAQLQAYIFYQGTSRRQFKASQKTIEIEKKLRSYRIDDMLEVLTLAMSLMNQGLSQKDVSQFSQEVGEKLELKLAVFEANSQIESNRMWRTYDRLTALETNN